MDDELNILPISSTIQEIVRDESSVVDKQTTELQQLKDSLKNN